MSKWVGQCPFGHKVTVSNRGGQWRARTAYDNWMPLRFDPAVPFTYYCCEADIGRTVTVELTEVPSTPKALEDITLGCDPEFSVYDSSGRRCNVSQWLGAYGGLGYDHGGRVAEVRPQYAKNARTVVKRIRDLMVAAPAGMRRAGKWRAGAYSPDPDMPMGGHIHLGVEMDEQGPNGVEALDALTTALYKLDLLPERDNARRIELGYGQLGNIRYETKGGGIMCAEYRSMPSWLYDPRVALLALAGAKFVAADPKAALELLDPKVAGHKKLHEFFGRFKGKSLDAQYITEKVLVDGLKVDPTSDIRDTWELPESKKEPVKAEIKVTVRDGAEGGGTGVVFVRS